MKGNIGLTTAIWVVGLIAVVVIAAVVVGVSMQAPAAQNQPVTVYIDDVKQSGNYSEPQALTWPADAIAGWTYDVNFTVVNNMEDNVRVTLITTAPDEAALSWGANDTMIAPTDRLSDPLTVTDYTQGDYTWTIRTSNQPTTSPTPSPSTSPTPSPSPSPTPEPLTLECTVNAGQGTFNVTVTNNAGQKITKLATDLPFKFPFTQGDTLTFKANNATGYTFAQWTFADATWNNDNPLKLTNIQGNLTLTAEFTAD